MNTKERFTLHAITACVHQIMHYENKSMNEWMEWTKRSQNQYHLVLIYHMPCNTANRNK